MNNSSLNKVDNQYHTLLKHILTNGSTKGDRTGTGTIATFGNMLHFDLSDGTIPLLTTKKVHAKSVIIELLWFLSGSTNIQWLEQNNCTIWTEWPYKKYCAYMNDAGEIPLTIEDYRDTIRTNNVFARNFGELGPVYGKQWRNFNGIDQISIIIDTLRTNPESRRIMLNAWNAAELSNVALPPCHYGFQLYTEKLSFTELWNSVELLYDTEHKVVGAMKEDITDHAELLAVVKSYNLPTDKLSLMWNQRSVDTFLGLPFNIASYGLLLHMFAQQSNMAPGILSCALGDTHIYSNHISYVKEQLLRNSPGEPPTLRLNKQKDIFSYKFSDFEIIEYNALPNWKNVPIAI